MPPALRGELVLGVEAEDGVRQALARRARRHRAADLEGAEVAEVDERPQAAGEERVPEAGRAEGDLVVAVEDAEDPLEVEGQVRHPRQLVAALPEAFLAEEVHQDRRAVGLGQVVIVILVEEAVADAHEPQLVLEAPGQRGEGDRGLRQLDVERRRAVGRVELLARLDDDVGARVGVDGPVECQLDLAREEALGLAREGGEGLVGGRALVAEVPDEVADHAHVEEELALPAGAVEGVGFARPQQIAGRGQRGRGRRGRRGNLGDRRAPAAWPPAGAEIRCG